MLVTLKEYKEHLRVEHDEEDTYLELLLKMAQGAAEDFCKQSFEDAAPPEPVRLAVLLHASHFYNNRENASKDAYAAMTQAFHALLWPHRNPDKLV